ncbi:MAG: tRNA pseudouridine(55) synthase TruB [Lachnospiraceae bacterium]|nr:tRNA pseudouridine(55) synthase TruB [Lachnospiraceae bacterium]
MVNGIINVYKEKGYTSHDVVAKLRGIFRQKKIGHTGTLDPDAEGVLPVCLGKATRVCDLLADKDKVYDAVLRLGIVTDTQDMTGQVQSEREAACTQEEIEETIRGFVGDYWQTPPMYSALKVNGKKLCDLARAGVEVERKPRQVTLYSIQMEEVSLPRVRMRVHCSKGTYIRTLCHDIGQALGCGGCMESLVRTQVADFMLQEAHRIAEVEAWVKRAREQAIQTELRREDLLGLVANTDSVFTQYPEVSVKEEFSRLLYNGNPLLEEWAKGWKAEYRNLAVRVYDSRQAFIGIYHWEEKIQKIKPMKIFME